MGIRIYLAGRVAVEVDGRIVVDESHFRGRQGRLVFAYLVCERTRPVSREELARIVWPRETALAWEVALSALMSRLHRHLSADDLRCRGVSLARGFGQYRLILPADVWIDLEAATTAIDEAEGALRAGRPQMILGPATVAANISRRPFCSDVEGEWVESQRRKLERQLLRSLECLSEMWLSEGEPGLAEETSTQAMEIDPFRETSYQLLMRAYMAGGNRAKALMLYEHLRRLLTEELGADPSSETQMVYLRLLG